MFLVKVEFNFVFHFVQAQRFLRNTYEQTAPVSNKTYGGGKADGNERSSDYKWSKNPLKPLLKKCLSYNQHSRKMAPLLRETLLELMMPRQQFFS
jgi:hypothetical protein